MILKKKINLWLHLLSVKAQLEHRKSLYINEELVLLLLHIMNSFFLYSKITGRFRYKMYTQSVVHL